MAISDDPQRQLRKSVKRRSASQFRKHWSDSQKLEAVQSFLVLGSLKLVSGALKIPYDTLKLWRKMEWWKQIENDLKVQDDLQLSARLKKIVNKSYDVVEDRLENGDFVYDQKTGKMRRKPVALRDAHRVAIDLMEKEDELKTRHIQGDTVTQDKTEKMLKDLAESFKKIAESVNQKTPIDVTDVIFGDDKPHAKEIT